MLCGRREQLLIESAELVNIGSLGTRAQPPEQQEQKAENEQRGSVRKPKGAMPSVETIPMDRIQKIAHNRKCREQQIKHGVLVQTAVAEHGKHLQKGKRSDGKANGGQTATDGTDQQRKGEKSDETEIGAVVTNRIFFHEDAPFFA